MTNEMVRCAAGMQISTRLLLTSLQRFSYDKIGSLHVAACNWLANAPYKVSQSFGEFLGM